jgi:tetratricopeptide (TPR) repeat protein
LYLKRAEAFYFDVGDFEAVIKDCTTVLKLDEKNYAALVLRALAYLGAHMWTWFSYKEEKGDYQKAIADCDLALKYEPKGAGALVVRAAARCFDDAGAIADLTRAIKIDPSNVEALTRRAILSLNQIRRWPSGEKSTWLIRRQRSLIVYRCIQDLRKSIKLNPEQAIAWQRLGDAYLHDGDCHQAEQAYKKAAAIDPAYTRYFLVPKG